MPLYDWKCPSCNSTTTVVQSIRDSDVPPEKCDSCGTPPTPEKPFEKLISKTSFNLRGYKWFSKSGEY